MTRGVGGQSPASIAKCLGGIDFPADKDELIRHARENDADQDVLEVLRQMPQQRYESMADVMKGVGRVE